MHPVVRTILQAAESFRGKIYLDGNGDYLTVPDSDDWTLGSGNGCIEMLLNFTSVSTSTIAYLIGQYVDTANYWYFRKNDDPNQMWKIEARSGGSTLFSLLGGSDATVPTSGVETHIALVKNGTTFQIYVGGTSVYSATDTDAMPNIAAPLTIFEAVNVSTNIFAGKSGGVRWTKGDARYTGNFTPPTEFTVDSANVKLCLRFSESLGATTFIDDTGKTVTTVGNAVIVV
jgi:hypothetical protein